MSTRWAPGACKLLAWDQGLALLDGGVGDQQAEALWRVVRRDARLGSFLQALMETTGAGLLNLPPFAVAILDGHGAHVAVRGSWSVLIRANEQELRPSGEGITTWEEKLVAGATVVEIQAPGKHERSLPIVCGITDAGWVAWTDGDGSPSPVEPAAAREEVVADDPDEESDDAGSGDDPDVASEEASHGEHEQHEPPHEDHDIPLGPPGHARGGDETIELTSIPKWLLSGNDSDREPDEPRDGLTVTDDGDATVATFPGDRAPKVLAAFCAAGHPNPPQRVQCHQCNAPVSGQPQLVERPQLGWLRVTGGETVPLRGPVVAGRNPKTSALSTSEAPRLIALPHQHISSNHIAFIPEGWSVLVRDLGSSNGSYLRRHGNPPVRLPENDTPLVPGDVIDLGHGVFINLDRIP